MKVAVYSTKNYDHKYLSQVNEAFGFEMEYFDFLLTPRTVLAFCLTARPLRR